MEDIFDFGGFDDFDDGPALPPSDTTGIFTSEAFYHRSHEYWMQVPLPLEHVPVGGNPLASLDDDTLLNMSPALIVHVQRTAAMGGLQVVSPRAVSLASMAARTSEPVRSSDMFLVGSNANRNLDWPVIRDPVPAHLFPGEPIDSYPSELAARPKVVTTGLVSALGSVKDPVLKAFIIGRACVDLQRRSDVAGSADALSKLLAGCWGIDQDQFDSMSEASLAPTGELLRYAIRADETYPIINAPVHARKVISVAANTAGRHLYGETAAIDWRRLRVLAESVYYMSVRTEGYTLAQMALSSPPGDPRADPRRPGILQFRPKPGTVWSYDASTFRVDIAADPTLVKAVDVPDRVADAVRSYYEAARPLAIAADAGVHLSTVTSMARQPAMPSSDQIVAGYKAVLSVVSAYAVRGRTSSAAVRDYMYQYMATNSDLSVLRTLWTIKFLRDTAYTMGIPDLLDVVTTRHVATRLVELITDMRMRLAVEAGRRGYTLDEWWCDLTALLPKPICELSEGSASWAQAVSHLMLHPPTSKWQGLTGAMAHASHASLAAANLENVRLPVEFRSTARVHSAADATVRHLAKSYGAFYGAMFDVSGILAAQLRRRGASALANQVTSAGLMWDIRAKLASTSRLEIESEKTTNVIASRRERYRIACSPHAAYTRWKDGMFRLRTSTLAKMKTFPNHITGKVSDVFRGRNEALFGVAGLQAVRLFRYVTSPAKLHEDMEKTLGMMLADVNHTVQLYESEEAHVPEPIAERVGTAVQTFDLPDMRPAPGTFWDLLPQLESGMALEIDDLVMAMDDDAISDIHGRTYDDPTDLANYVLGRADEAAASKMVKLDEVR